MTQPTVDGMDRVLAICRALEKELAYVHSPHAYLIRRNVRKVIFAAAEGRIDIARPAALRLHSRIFGTSVAQMPGMSGPQLQRSDRLAYDLYTILSKFIDRTWTAPALPPASRRVNCAVHIAVRLLPPGDRARYREEFAAELADLPRIDQAPYALRLITRAWALRVSLSGNPVVRPARVVVVIGAGAGVFDALIAVSWPGALLGSVVTLAGAWTISSGDRTRRLASLIKSARGPGRSGPKR